MPIRILIAEQQNECCQLYRQFLQRCGYEVTAVYDGVSCIESLSNGITFDVLILSWELPDGEGEGVLDWVRYHRLDQMAVVILTARMDENDALQESVVPGARWVQRPFRLFELLDAVQSMESVPRNDWRCLEALLRKSTEPVRGVLFDSQPSTRDFSEQRQ